MKTKFLAIVLVLLLGTFLRFFALANIPKGIDSDEASIGYDAYSLLKTGKDRYGEAFPIFLRSFGNYQSPLYAYLTVIPIAVFDLSAFSARFVSALSGVLILICTFFLILNFKHPRRFEIATLVTLFMAISPWAVLFSRTAVEANLALALFVFSVLLFILSIRKAFWLFPFACITLAFSTYAYHAERVISFVFLVGFVWFFKKELFKKKIVLILGLIIFLIIQIPQFALLNSPAYKTRLTQVQYWNEAYTNNKFKNIPYGGYLSIIRKFAAQYSAYYSPKNLFFDSDEQPIRSMPDMGVFYSWMIIPFIVGLSIFLKDRSNPIIKILLLITVISPLPAAVTREPFYSLRVLPLFWVITIIISFGIFSVLEKIRLFFLKYLTLISLVLFCLVLLYNSYFILLKYERMDSFGYYNIELVKLLDKYQDKKIVVDSTRLNLGIWYFFTKKYDPTKLQESLKNYVSRGYYSSTEFDEKYKIDNIEIRPLSFEVTCKDYILIGDLLSISDNQVKEHNLKEIIEIKDLNNKLMFKGYLTNPTKKC